MLMIFEAATLAVRSGNAPAGDYAELLVQRATGGELAPEVVVSSTRFGDRGLANGSRYRTHSWSLRIPMAAGDHRWQAHLTDGEPPHLALTTRARP